MIPLFNEILNVNINMFNELLHNILQGRMDLLLHPRNCLQNLDECIQAIKFCFLFIGYCVILVLYIFKIFINPSFLYFFKQSIVLLLILIANTLIGRNWWGRNGPGNRRYRPLFANE